MQVDRATEEELAKARNSEHAALQMAGRMLNSIARGDCFSTADYWRRTQAIQTAWYARQAELDKETEANNGMDVSREVHQD